MLRKLWLPSVAAILACSSASATSNRSAPFDEDTCKVVGAQADDMPSRVMEPNEQIVRAARPAPGPAALLPKRNAFRAATEKEQDLVVVAERREEAQVGPVGWGPVEQVQRSSKSSPGVLRSGEVIERASDAAAPPLILPNC